MKDLPQLLSTLKGLGTTKSAAADPEKLPDPNEKGEVTKSKDQGTEEIEPPPSSEPGKGEDDPMNPKDVKTESNGGEPSPTKMAGSDFAKKAQGLREKMATIDWGAEPEKEAGAEEGGEAPQGEKAPEKEAGAEEGGEAPQGEKAPEKEAGAEEGGEAPQGEEGPEKEAGAEEYPASVCSQIVGYLTKTASGRSLLNQSLDEVLGDQAARALVEKAASEQEEAEVQNLQRRMIQAEMNKRAAAHQQQVDQLNAYFAELTKDASAEDLEKIEATQSHIKAASEFVQDNETAAEFYSTGMKVAAAMMQAQDAGAEAPMDAGMAPPAEGPPTDEEIAAALAELVQEGLITEEQAMQMLEILSAQMSGAAGGAPPEGGAQKAASAEGNARIQVLHKVASNIFEINGKTEEGA